MSNAVLERLIGSFMSLPLPQYAFGWQGGEPALMGAEFFRRVTTLQSTYGHKGAVVANGLQTNATLISDELAAHLGEYRFLVGVSLDGPAEIHDYYRRDIAGRGTHTAVMRAIERLRHYKVEFNILVLVTNINVGRAREVYDYLVSEGFYYHQYIPCVEFDHHGHPRPFTITGEQWGKFLCDLYDRWKARDTRRVSVRLFDAIVANLVDGSRPMCTMGRDCRQYFVVEWNGDVYPCDFFVSPDFRIGNIMNMRWDQALQADVYRRFGLLKGRLARDCLVCEYLSLCAGDCLKHREYRGSHGLSWLCEGWKRFYAHALPGLVRLADIIRRGRDTVGAGQPAAGRNDPCPCGSGLKYKKCCMSKKQ